MTHEDKLNALHDHLLDPDDGLFVRLTEIKVELRETRSAFAKHEATDTKAFGEVGSKLAAIEQTQAKRKGWLLGVLAAVTATGGAAGSKLAGWFGS